MPDKIRSLLSSRRFWLSVAGVVAVAFNDVLGISEDEVLSVAGIVIAWVIGDSVRRTG